MAELKRVYWDSCVWISLINQDSADRVKRCQYVLDMARRKEIEVWTSALTLAEVFKKKCEGANVALPGSKDSEFEQYIQQDHLVLVQLDYDIGVEARRLLRAFPALKKPPDGIHLATAALNNIDEVHTFDGDNLLPLSGFVTRADGTPLTICEPPAPTQGALELLPPDESDTSPEANRPPPEVPPNQAAAEKPPYLGLVNDTKEDAPSAVQPVTGEGVSGGADSVRPSDSETGQHDALSQGAKESDGKA